MNLLCMALLYMMSHVHFALLTDNLLAVHDTPRYRYGP
jgi:hypothetical protein